MYKLHVSLLNMFLTKKKHFHYPIPLNHLKIDGQFLWIAKFFKVLECDFIHKDGLSKVVEDVK